MAFRFRILIASLLALIGLLGSPKVQAASCGDLLRNLSVNSRVNQLFSEDFAEKLIQDLKPQVDVLTQKDPELRPHTVESIFKLYMDHRLQNLSEKVQIQVREVMDSGFRFKIFETDSGQPPPFEAYSHRELYMIFLVLPASVHQTALDYFIRVHELEHIVQYYAIGKGVLSELHPTRHLNQLYFERGAMRSEAAFLKLFSKEYLRRILTQWKSDPHQPGLADDVFESVVLHTLQSETVGEYVLLQWEHGRYSRKTFMQRHISSHLRLWSSTAALTAPLWLKFLGVY